MAVHINVYSVQLSKVKGGRYDLDSHVIRSPRDAYLAIESVFDLGHKATEHFGLMALNVKKKITGMHIISIGTLDTTLVHPREVYQAAILNAASAIIVYHNHPSGDPTPSHEDIAATMKLIEAGKILGIDVLDHIIVGDGRYASLKERGDI